MSSATSAQDLRGHGIALKLLVPLTVLLAALLLVFFVIFDTVEVEGDSMAPTLLPSDRLLVTKGYDEPLAGDIVSIGVDRQGVSVGLLKRVVATPGDRVDFEGTHVRVNGADVPPRTPMGPPLPAPAGSLIVPEDTVFVLGDNRLVSRDSRFYGPVPLDDVAGRVVFIFTPVNRISLVDGSPERD